MAFGGRSWPINAQDMNLGPISIDSDTCLGGIGVYNATLGDGYPTWYFGTVFLKNVYSVFSFQPPKIGFAELNEVIGPSE